MIENHEFSAALSPWVTKAKQGNLVAISLVTGVSRQTLHRWKRKGETITLERIREILAEKKDRDLVWGRTRGRPISTEKQRRLPGFSRKEKFKANKDLANAIVDLTEALASVRKMGGCPKNTLDRAVIALHALHAVVPLEIFQKDSTPSYPTKNGKNG